MRFTSHLSKHIVVTPLIDGTRHSQLLTIVRPQIQHGYNSANSANMEVTKSLNWTHPPKITASKLSCQGQTDNTINNSPVVQCVMSNSRLSSINVHNIATLIVITHYGRITHDMAININYIGYVMRGSTTFKVQKGWPECSEGATRS